MKAQKYIPCRACMNESFPGYKTKIDKNGRQHLIECDCHKLWRETKEIIINLNKANIPSTKFILNYNPEEDYYGEESLIVKFNKIVNVLSKPTEESYLLYLYGDKGTQKTTISWWIGLQLIKHKIKTYYISMQTLLEDIIVSFDTVKEDKKKKYETVPILIIDDCFSPERVTLFKNKNYQLAPFNTLLRKRFESSEIKHTIIISDCPVGKIGSLGFTKDIEYYIESRASKLNFPDEFLKEVSKFNPKDIFS